MLFIKKDTQDRGCAIQNDGKDGITGRIMIWMTMQEKIRIARRWTDAQWKYNKKYIDVSFIT